MHEVKHNHARTKADRVKEEHGIALRREEQAPIQILKEWSQSETIPQKPPSYESVQSDG